jgi:hypothetical protein
MKKRPRNLSKVLSDTKGLMYVSIPLLVSINQAGEQCTNVGACANCEYNHQKQRLKVEQGGLLEHLNAAKQTKCCSPSFWPKEVNVVFDKKGNLHVTYISRSDTAEIPRASLLYTGFSINIFRMIDAISSPSKRHFRMFLCA